MDERKAVTSRYEGLKESIAEAVPARDPDGNELAMLASMRDRLSEIDEKLAITTADISLRADTAARIAALMPGTSVAPRDFTYRRGQEGQALYDCLHRSTDEEARGRWNKAVELQRAAQHMGTTAAGTTPVAGGFDNLYVTPILGPVIQLYPTDTPFLNLLGPKTPPAGRFMRPRLVDPDLLTAAGPHAGGLEKGEFPSKRWNYDSDAISMVTIGNYINLSYEAIEWVPDSLQSVINHLRLRTALGIETAAVAEADKTGAVVELDDAADAAATQAAVWDAMAQVYLATGSPATWLVSGPLGLSKLGSTVDTTGRPLFPVIGPTNAPGTASGFSVIQPFGLRYAQTPAITGTALYVGNETSLEGYVRWLPTLQADEPSVYGRQIGVAASVGWFHPVTDEAAGEHNAIVKIADTVP